ncbi:MAG: hypothetical protein IPM23_20060 [Candidatus Melainabacteria bacterium]|nr:hypothetical protein [Candidatus Melainabacteria bacterium]
MQKLARSTSIGIKEKHQVADAAAHLGCRVTTADVSARTGLPLTVTGTLLNQLAADTGGSVEVDESGQLVYRLPPGFRSIFLGRRLKAALKPVFLPAYHAGAYLFRCFMAIMLMVSPVMIVSIYSLALTKEGKARDRELLNLLRPFLSLFAWHYDPNDLERLPSYLQYPPETNSSYAYDIVTFLLGNAYSYREENERQWRYIATLIRTNAGVVTSEQLAPYTGSRFQDEYSVASVLARFDGHPEVTASGNIVYVFPSLQVSTSENIADELPELFEEKKIRFGSARGSRATFLWSFAFMNLLFYLPLVRAIDWLAEPTPESVFACIYVTFGMLFAVIPACRLILTLVLNLFIDLRNRRRRENLALLAEPSPELVVKLEEAKRFARELDYIDGSKLEYHTGADLVEQVFGDTVPDYIRQNKGRVVTVEPEQAPSIKKLAEVLDPDSMILINPPAGKAGLALFGSYRARSVFVLIEQSEWDHDRIEIAFSCRTDLDLEIARPIPKNFVSSASFKKVAVAKLRSFFPSLEVYRPASEPAPQWLTGDHRFKDILTGIFRRHNVERVVVREGVRIIKKASGLKRLNDLLQDISSLAELIENQAPLIEENA